jgi:DnaJ-class molecular chaperone
MEKRPQTPRRNAPGWGGAVVAFKEAQRKAERDRMRPQKACCIMCDGRGTYTDHMGEGDCPECLGTGDR